MGQDITRVEGDISTRFGFRNLWSLFFGNKTVSERMFRSKSNTICLEKGCFVSQMVLSKVVLLVEWNCLIYFTVLLFNMIVLCHHLGTKT